jgi:hypothetical protein
VAIRTARSTALHFAALGGSIKVMKFLLKRGVDLSLTMNRFGVGEWASIQVQQLAQIYALTFCRWVPTISARSYCGVGRLNSCDRVDG